VAANASRVPASRKTAVSENRCGWLDGQLLRHAGQAGIGLELFAQTVRAQGLAHAAEVQRASAKFMVFFLVRQVSRRCKFADVGELAGLPLAAVQCVR
jgi:hypothetical protein